MIQAKREDDDVSEPKSECPLVGTWKLQGWEILVKDDPTTAPPKWARSKGQIMYGSDGTMSMLMSNADREPFAAAAYHTGTTEEIVRAFDDFRSYAGTYLWEGDRVTHFVEQSNYPNIIGVDQVRLVTLDGTTLTLTNENKSIALTWERVAAP